MESRLEIRVEPWTDAHDAEVREAFSGHTRRKMDTSAGLLQPTEYLRQGAFCRVLRDDEPVCWYVLFVHRYLTATEVEVALAYGHAEFDLVAEVLPLIELQCCEADSICITTRRRGLVKKLQRQGYRTDAVLMRKQRKKG